MTILRPQKRRARFKWPLHNAVNTPSVVVRPTVGHILEPMLELQTAEGDAAWEKLALSQRQWDAVCSHEAKNRQIKSLWRRMVNVEGAARTLIGSYRPVNQFIVFQPRICSRNLMGSIGVAACDLLFMLTRALLMTPSHSEGMDSTGNRSLSCPKTVLD